MAESGGVRVIAGRWRLGATLARGGMGVVYQATHAVTARRVAVKLLDPWVASDPVALERFVREARTPGEIGHPGIVEVVDAGVDEGTPFVAMELLSGQSLGAWARTTRPRRREVLEKMLEMLDALAAAHRGNVVHRDLKPDNVFLAREADGAVRVKLLDFGLARQVHAEGPTRTGAFLGTYRYVSPEQARSPRDVGPPSDVWSVGVMLYEAIAGRPPFEGDAAESVLAAFARPHLPLEWDPLESTCRHASLSIL